MSRATNTKLMDTEPGGENTHYEGAKVFQDQIPPVSKVNNPDQASQFDVSKSEKSEAEKQAQEEKRKKGERTAANIRYGEAISEHGFGGETVGNSAGVGEGSVRTEDEKNSREVSGYGPGSGVGA